MKRSQQQQPASASGDGEEITALLREIRDELRNKNEFLQKQQHKDDASVAAA